MRITVESLRPVGRFQSASDAPGVPPRGRTGGEIVDLATEVLRARSAACLGPAFVLSGLGALAALSWQRYAVGGAAGFVQQCAALTAGWFALAASVPVVYEVLCGRALSARAALRSSTSRALGLVLLALCTVLLATLLGAVLFAQSLGVQQFAGYLLTPLVLAMWWLSASTPAYLVEDLGLRGALKRGMQLVRGSFGRWFFALLTVGPCAAVLLAPAWLAGDYALRERLRAWLDLPRASFELAVLLGAAVGGALAWGLIGVTSTVLYHDARTRQEGLELWGGLEEIGARWRQTRRRLS